MSDPIDFYPVRDEMFWALYQKLRSNTELAKKISFAEAVELFDVCSTASVAAKRVYDSHVAKARL